MVLTLGQGDVGQLGLGENVMERKKPALVPIPEDIVQAEAGGMHTVCLSKSGQVGWVGWHRIGQGLGLGGLGGLGKELRATHITLWRWSWLAAQGVA